MSIFFSPAERIFIDPDLWPHDLPDDIIPISSVRHARILEELSAGRVLEADGQGHPISVEAPAPSTETLATLARHRRDAEIAQVRWLVERHRDELALQIATTLTPEDYRLVQEHVQALRDVPEQESFPLRIDWPVLPPELLATGA